MPQLNPVNAPIPLPRPQKLTPQLNSAPAKPTTTVPPQRMELSPKTQTQAPTAPKLGAAVPAIELFGEPKSEWQPLRDRVASELPRIDKLPGFKADINVARLKGMLAALDGPENQRVSALATELKKAGYGATTGTPPSESGVMTSLARYLDDINKDYHLRPRK